MVLSEDTIFSERLKATRLWLIGCVMLHVTGNKRISTKALAERRASDGSAPLPTLESHSFSYCSTVVGV